MRNGPTITPLTRTVGAVGHGEARGQGVEPGLRRGVGQVVGAGPDRGDAADVDDRPAAAGGHALAHQGAQPERALQVDPDDLVEQLLGDRGQARVERGHAGVVDQDVDRAEGVVRGLDQPVQLGPAPDVAGVRERPPPGGLDDLGGQLLAGLDPPAGDHDVGAGRGERADHLPAEPARPAGDQRDLPGQVDVAGAVMTPPPGALGAAQQPRREAGLPAIRGSVLSPRSQRIDSCWQTTAIFQLQNASYQAIRDRSAPVRCGVAGGHLGPGRQAHGSPGRARAAAARRPRRSDRASS